MRVSNRIIPPSELLSRRPERAFRAPNALERACPAIERGPNAAPSRTRVLEHSNACSDQSCDKKNLGMTLQLSKGGLTIISTTYIS